MTPSDFAPFERIGNGQAASVERPQLVTDAIARKDWSWPWLWASPEAKASVDRWLVAISHPLAFQPGTAEYRFRAIVAELSEASHV